MVACNIDDQASSITIRTRAKGLLSKLAHDLEIQVERFEGDVDVDGDSWTATLTVPAGALRVVGALKRGRVDDGVLSSNDKAEIDRKIRNDVVPDAVRIAIEGRSPTQARVDVVVATGSQRIDGHLDREGASDGAMVAYGQLTLSLRALGIKEIKGPLGAFKVDDAIDVAFWMKVTRPAA